MSQRRATPSPLRTSLHAETLEAVCERFQIRDGLSHGHVVRAKVLSTDDASKGEDELLVTLFSVGCWEG